jgi:hypothetical protein
MGFGRDRQDGPKEYAANGRDAEEASAGQAKRTRETSLGGVNDL